VGFLFAHEQGEKLGRAVAALGRVVLYGFMRVMSGYAMVGFLNGNK
jgi:hypothetical protein